LALRWFFAETRVSFFYFGRCEQLFLIFLRSGAGTHTSHSNLTLT
jgi:hypothetical protein